jgi:hypothetical protein
MSLEEITARHGRPGFMKRAFPPLPPARRFTALDVTCPACGVSSGTACPAPRVCPERFDLALDLMRRGDLPERVVADQVADAAECELCGVERTQRGRPSHTEGERRWN